jgi:phosphatidate phosphatase APP1
MQTAHQPIPAVKSWKETFLNWFRLTAEPTVKVYHGYGHMNRLTVFGHVLKLTAFPRRKFRGGIIRNTLALLRLFMVKPYPHVTVEMEWKGKKYQCKTDIDGFYKFDWQDEEPFARGWHDVKVIAVENNKMIAAAKGSVYIPEPTQYIFVSDIDDTFLVSHSSNLRKRLFVLFTNNARSRKPFEGVVRHYELLRNSNTTETAPNPFFYVSSSEWNLYDYLTEFISVNKIPKGIYLLNQLKQFTELLKTGQNNHQTKFTRIVRILQSFPTQRVVLLGDSSQHDPYIYESIVKHFPKQVHAVYIRDIYKKNMTAVAEVLHKIESAGVPCCFFQHSSEAIMHSVKIGLVPPAEAAEKIAKAEEKKTEEIVSQ